MTNIFGGSYPPGCSSVPDDEEKVIEITEQLQAMGRRQHGLCGKDADLDYGGQIKVNGAFLLEEAVEAHLQVYASIVPPEDEAKAEIAQEIVMNWIGNSYPEKWNSYNGEWDGDYWTFKTENAEHGYKVKVPFKWNDRHGDKANVNRAVKTLYKAIFADPGIKSFQESMTELAKALDSIE